MTIQYNHHVSTSSAVNVVRLISRWNGSVWKAVLRGLIVWILLFQIIGNFYTFALSPKQQRFFRKVSIKMNEKMSYIPLEFILGFFVSAVVKRWTDIVRNMGYLDDVAIYVGNLISGNDDTTRMLRRTIVRYVCLTQVLVFRDICENVRKRFPTYDSLVKAGFLLPEEKEKLESYIQVKNFTPSEDEGNYWVPLNWALSYSVRARKDKKIVTDMWATRLTDFVFLAVNVYFALCLYTRQFIVTDDKSTRHGTYHVAFPLITVLQYTFYVGWMKVAAALMNPFGDREDDLEANFLINRNFATCLFIVDNAIDDSPELKKDQFWDSDCCGTGVHPPLGSIHALVGSAAYAGSKRNKRRESSMTIVRKPTRRQITDHTRL